MHFHAAALQFGGNNGNGGKRMARPLLSPILLSIAALWIAAPAALAQTFSGNETTNGPFSSGTQDFYDNSMLNAIAADAVSGGIQFFYNNSVLNATATNAVSGGSQNFYGNYNALNASAV